jgi:hypothetical protein
MTKSEIDNYFTNNYKAIFKTTTSRLWNNNKAYIQQDVVINNCYIHIIEHIDKIKTISTLESFIYKYITNESYWQFGKANKQEAKNNADLNDNYDEVECNEDLENKIQDEITYQNRKYILEMFYQSLNRSDKNLYEMYFVKEKRTSRTLAAHLNISKTSALMILREFKLKMNNFIENNKNNNEQI